MTTVGRAAFIDILFGCYVFANILSSPTGALLYRLQQRHVIHVVRHQFCTRAFQARCDLEQTPTSLHCSSARS